MCDPADLPSFSRSEVFERLLFLYCYFYGQLLTDKYLFRKSRASSFCPLFFYIPTAIGSAHAPFQTTDLTIVKVLDLTHTAPGYFFLPCDHYSSLSSTPNGCLCEMHYVP